MTIDDGNSDTVSNGKTGKHVDPNLEPDADPNPKPDPYLEISIGAGIAIAGIWLASVSLSAFLIFLFFIWIPGSGGTVSSTLSLLDIALTSCVVFVPLIIAWGTTKAIIYREKP